ncbi:hypothetical protein DCC39_09515 [Pueribacillus theae]|uniref:Uncharacterized protein n=1 Tax=Pueribacillus theae TaxID=2171751 RepID=A0A2U1K138_9BACI|nr:hypothetical protein DCC39_09515 [Pueribacillus theae]
MTALSIFSKTTYKKSGSFAKMTEKWFLTNIIWLLKFINVLYGFLDVTLFCCNKVLYKNFDSWIMKEMRIN